jgi:hypothetical protein
MRLIVFFISLLCGCSTPTVRCDAHLKPINSPAARPAASAAATGASAAGGGVTEVSDAADSAGGTPPSRRAP